MKFVTVTAESKDSRVNCRAYMACFAAKELKALVVVGPEQSCKAIFASLNTNQATVKVGTYFVTKCPYHYTRQHHPLPCKWTAMLVKSKDPHCLWNDDTASLIQAFKVNTETPFMEEWEPWLRMKLEGDKKLSKFLGFNPMGSYLDCDTEALDALVVDGIKSNLIHLQGTANASE